MRRTRSRATCRPRRTAGSRCATGSAYFAGAESAARRVVRTRRASIARLVRSLGGEREGNVRRTVEPRLYRSTMYEIDSEASGAIAALAARALRPADGAARGVPRLRLARRAASRLPPRIRRRRRAQAAERIARLIRAEGIEPRTMQRKGRTVVYLKGLDAIVIVLSAIGAHGAVLRLEDVRARQGNEEPHPPPGEHRDGQRRPGRRAPRPRSATRSPTWRTPTACATSRRRCARRPSCGSPTPTKRWPNSAAARRRRSEKRRSTAGSSTLMRLVRRLREPREQEPRTSSGLSAECYAHWHQRFWPHRPQFHEGALERHPGVEIVAVNDLTSAAECAHLFKYDSNYGTLRRRA